MSTPVVMPQLSLSMREGIISKWYKSEGDYVQLGEPICIIEGDKATVDVESPVEGYLLKVIAVEGEEFPVKQPMAYIGEKDELVSNSSEKLPGVPSPEQASQVVKPQTTHTETSTSDGKIKASPVAKRLAGELGIDLAQLTGTGPGGIIGRDDVLKAKEAASQQSETPPQASPEVDREYVPSGIKKLVAERMKESYTEAPHIHLTLTCEMAEASRLREQVNEKQGSAVHITVTDILLLATGLVLKDHPFLNATYRDEKITTFAEANVGFAVASEKGLIVPVVRQINRLSLLEVAAARQALTDRVRAGTQTPEDLAGGTFTVTNLGMFGIEAFDPIITPGQAGILAAGKVANALLIDEDGRMRVTPTLTLTLACDHRIADGVDGARFLADLKALLENPERLFTGLV
jgi:pyruvate dehydrogenase E2 component (dihydrolipoamide acetyltransferase)